MFWTEVLTALALVLVLEGMLPFISPSNYRRMVVEVTKLGDNSIRNIGLIVMVVGLLLLFLVRG